MEPSEKIVFIATKPLQIMVAMTVKKEIAASAMFHLYVVEYFSDALEVTNRIKEKDNSWATVRVFSTREDALSACKVGRFDSLFIDSDVGLKIYLKLREIKKNNSGIKLSVYEEGCGTYEDDYYSKTKAALLRFLGIGDRLGGCSLTEKIWVYEREEYLSIFPKSEVKALAIQETLSCFIESNLTLLGDIFFNGEEDTWCRGNSIHATCIVYLSSWEVDENAIRALKTFPGNRYIKLHPHIKQYDVSFAEKYSILVPTSVPAEMLLMNLANQYSHVTVIHHNSSVERYISRDNVEFITV